MSSKGANRAGAAFRRLVDLVSHRSGLAVTVMNDAGISLPQVLLMSHVERGAVTPTELANAMHVSMPAVSQMLDRLVQQKLLERKEDRVDRRRKAIATTPASRSFLRKLEAARSREYGLGLASVPNELLVQMTSLAERIVATLEKEPTRRR